MDEHEHKEIDLKPVSFLTTDAIGPPGQRVFYIQGSKEEETISLIIEKFQLQTLTIGVEQFLAEIRQRYPLLQEATSGYQEDDMHISPPVEPLFRVSELGLSYDVENDLVGLIAREVPSTDEEEEGTIVRYWCTRAQIRSLAHWGIELVNRGRPLCEQCGQPMDPAGHFCSRKNGHKS
jgi:uncharacterized repeat protein (TIGR03847 family)